MSDQPPRNSHQTAGFTLLELLVVVTILVFLTVSVGTVALNYLGRAQADAARIQMTQIETGLDLFKLDVGRYPTTQEGLGVLVSETAGVERWTGPYVKDANVIEDPWGRTFFYENDATGSYALLSLGADGAVGGEGDDADITP